MPETKTRIPFDQLPRLKTMYYPERIEGLAPNWYTMDVMEWLGMHSKDYYGGIIPASEIPRELLSDEELACLPEARKND